MTPPVDSGHASKKQEQQDAHSNFTKSKTITGGKNLFNLLEMRHLGFLDGTSRQDFQSASIIDTLSLPPFFFFNMQSS